MDAAIAAALALAVVYPQAGNLAGGGFLVARTPDGSVQALDFRETAPALASREHVPRAGRETDPAGVHGVGPRGGDSRLGARVRRGAPAPRPPPLGEDRRAGRAPRARGLPRPRRAQRGPGRGARPPVAVGGDPPDLPSRRRPAPRRSRSSGSRSSPRRSRASRRRGPRRSTGERSPPGSRPSSGARRRPHRGGPRGLRPRLEGSRGDPVRALRGPHDAAPVVGRASSSASVLAQLEVARGPTAAGLDAASTHLLARGRAAGVRRPQPVARRRRLQRHPPRRRSSRRPGSRRSARRSTRRRATSRPASAGASRTREAEETTHLSVATPDGFAVSLDDDPERLLRERRGRPRDRRPPEQRDGRLRHRPGRPEPLRTRAVRA